MKKKGNGSLYSSFLVMTLLPLLVLGLVIIAFSAYAYTDGLHNEVKNGLKSIGVSVLASYDIMYPGDYNLDIVDENSMFLSKGGANLSGNNELIDEIRKQTGIDITLFFYDKRMLTTICDAEGDRVLDSTAHEQVIREVLEGQQEHFYDNVSIGGKKYFVYYKPFFGSDGTCIGMIGAAKPSEEVFALIKGVVIRLSLIIALAVLIVALFITRYTTNLIDVIKKIMKFLGEVADGNLSTELNPLVAKRDDELGEMGRFTIHVQASLRKLVERDALTGLYNRRSGQNKAETAKTKAEKSVNDFVVGIGDIDFFKKVNDTYGHEAGDLVLKEVARILGDGLIGKGFVARWGGEEFLLVFERMNIKEAERLLNDILDRIRANAVIHGEQEIKVTMTFGLVSGEYEKEMKEQIGAADARLYYGKEHGRNRVVAADVEEQPDC